MRSLKILPLVMAFFFATASHAYCFKEAGDIYQIDPLLLEAIAIHESHLDASTVLRNSNDTWDVGLMGINTVHLKDAYLINAGFRSPQDFLDPCTNVKIGAWLLSRKIQKWGPSWQAVGAYHSETPQLSSNYQRLIAVVFARIKTSVMGQR